MKIGMVCFPTYGGSGIVATELGKALAHKGHEVHFITYSMPVRLELFEKNIYYHEVSTLDYPLFEFPPYEFSLASKIIDIVLHESLDILHVHYAIPNAYVALTARRILEDKGVYIPIVTTLHGTDMTLVGKSELYKPAIQHAIKHSDTVTAVSEDLKRETCSYFEIDESVISVVPNFIDLQEYTFDKSPCDMRNAIATEEEKILVHISNFRPVKRVVDVVKIFYGVLQHQPVKLLMVGDGPDREQAELLCRELGISDSVRFMGKNPNVKKILAISDLMLLPSTTESFGLVALEAMASCVPVVSSNSGGLPEVNIHGKTGFTAPVGEIETMISFAVSILEDETTLNTFRCNARKESERFDIRNIVPQYEAVYAKHQMVSEIEK